MGGADLINALAGKGPGVRLRIGNDDGNAAVGNNGIDAVFGGDPERLGNPVFVGHFAFSQWVSLPAMLPD